MPTEKAQLRAIFDNLPLGIAYLDAQFKFIRINKFLAELTGMREEELLGKPCYETIGEYADDPARKGLEKICSFCKKEGCFNSKKACVIERHLKDRLLRVRTIPQMDEGRRIIYWSCSRISLRASWLRRACGRVKESAECCRRNIIPCSIRFIN